MKHTFLIIIIISSSLLLFGQENKCKCFNGIGSSENDKPSLTIEFRNGVNLSVCGYELEKKSETEIIISEFNVFNSKTGKSLVEYGAVQTCIVKSDANKLIITELKHLPTGENWKWKLIPIRKQIIKETGKEVVALSPQKAFVKIKIDQTKIDQFLSELEDLKGKGFNKDFDNIIGKLEVLALNNNSNAEKILLNFEKYFDFELDGAYAEQWRDARATLRWIKK